MRILIADDNERVRRGVKSILSDGNHEICGEAADGEQAVRMARELAPDMILLDVNMPRVGGLEAARLIRGELPEAKIVIMSQHDPLQLGPGAIAAGANICVDKTRLGSDLTVAIESLNDGSPQARPADDPA
jgi:DNA-binding NarL/FixJ family response regulator